MALSAKLELRNSQQLVMTPQLQQAIRLLQLSNLELTQYVETELERNPLLERDESSEGSTRDDAGTGDYDGETGEGASAQGEDEWLDLAKPVAESDGGLDVDYDNVFQDKSDRTTATSATGPDLGGANWTTVRGGSAGFSDEDSNLEAFVSSDVSLKDHLSQQLTLALTDPVQRLIGQYLIDFVDDAGYMTADLAELAERIGASDEQAEDVLGVMQTFDPPGVFARSLSECLALQLKELNRYDPQIACFLDNLDKLGNRDLQGLRRAVKVEMDELVEMINEIKTLDPKPGLKFGSVQVQPVVPDVMIRMASDGSWLVELNSDTLPRVLVNRTYFARVSKTASNNPEDKDYLVDCLQNANWLVKSLDQRARTILRVAEEIVRQQDGFFTYGVQHLRPLNLKTVAEAISMHESTVSRVTSNKYVATSRGIFELKFFFTSAIASASDDGEAHSSEAVRHRIRQLIDGESAKSILSDDRIVSMLKGDGIDIARRTVAKYREAMRIPSSVQRRREKRMSQSLNGYAQA